MKRLLAIIIVLLTGCATMTLPDNATPEQKREAACVDARALMPMAMQGVNNAKDRATRKYWDAYLNGLIETIEAYCDSRE